MIIEAQTRNLNVSEGEYAELECVARGNPRPDVMWVKVDSNEKVNTHDFSNKIQNPVK